MSQSRKSFKIVSFVIFILGVSFIATGALCMGDGDFMLFKTTNGTLAGIVYIVNGIVTILASIAGIMAANKPSKIGSAIGLGFVSVVTYAAQLAMALPMLGGSGFDITSVLLLLANVVFIEMAFKVKKENKDRL